MPNFNGWIIRALIVRLRQPEMQTQRRFVAVVGLILLVYVIGASIYLFQQPSPQAMEEAALRIFAGMGVLIAIGIVAALVVRKRTGARWSHGDALRMAGKRHEQQHTHEP